MIKKTIHRKSQNSNTQSDSSNLSEEEKRLTATHKVQLSYKQDEASTVYKKRYEHRSKAK